MQGQVWVPDPATGLFVAANANHAGLVPSNGSTSSSDAGVASILMQLGQPSKAVIDLTSETETDSSRGRTNNSGRAAGPQRRTYARTYASRNKKRDMFQYPESTTGTPTNAERQHYRKRNLEPRACSVKHRAKRNETPAERTLRLNLDALSRQHFTRMLHRNYIKGSRMTVGEASRLHSRAGSLLPAMSLSSPSISSASTSGRGHKQTSKSATFHTAQSDYLSAVSRLDDEDMRDTGDSGWLHRT